MTDPAPPPPARRRLLRFLAAGLFVAVAAEAVRVFALTNKHTVIPGRVYRSAQLTGDDLGDLIADKKVRTVINLRGQCTDQEWYLDECRATVAADISQEDIPLSAKRMPPPAEIRRLVEVLDRTEYPVVFHCQRGADRTGLASTIAVLLQTNATLAEARRQMWPWYGHIRAGRTAVLDDFFDYYAAWLKGEPHTPNRFREWVATAYCPGPYRAGLSLAGDNPPTVPAGKGFTLTVRAKNESVEPWTFRAGPAGGVHLRAQLFTPDGAILYKTRAGMFERTVPPGETIDLVVGFPPIEKPGRYLVHADLCDAQPIDLLDSDFVQYGSEPLVFDVHAE